MVILLFENYGTNTAWAWENGKIWDTHKRMWELEKGARLIAHGDGWRLVERKHMGAL